MIRRGNIVVRGNVQIIMNGIYDETEIIKRIESCNKETLEEELLRTQPGIWEVMENPRDKCQE